MNRALRYIIAGFVLVCVISSLRFKCLNLMGYRLFYILSDSMEPAIMTGDIVVAKVTDGSDIKEGDVAAYRLDGRVPIFIIHRVLSESEEGFIFKGDNNDAPDEMVVPKRRVMYKVIS